jgi:hypothetical protein
MALSRAKFKQVGNRLMQKAKDGNLTVSCVFSVAGTYDPITATYGAGSSETVQCVREEFKQAEVDNQAIMVGDYKLLALIDDFSAIVPKPDNVSLTVGGVAARIIDVRKDAADAIYTIQARNV